MEAPKAGTRRDSGETGIGALTLALITRWTWAKYGMPARGTAIRTDRTPSRWGRGPRRRWRELKPALDLSLTKPYRLDRLLEHEGVAHGDEGCLGLKQMRREAELVVATSYLDVLISIYHDD